ncbi:Myb-like DNA-binding domain containing protein [Tritrichomonas foetus]|uniref:Myb-like DNA-binding domain containing protein n=1 Tax=Tritrichomonas foetus TaxID=1144522 RepID=A0A1J4K0G3_9EUKA|nr:Myb-like DNA-binding domain containing protein [Tritrichomonas foetus]|eukprot:OHT04895.1 Myb-like DNA-binding domain containing protein [Tritrichomonas foetus]
MESKSLPSRTKFTIEEDQKLQSLVNEYGTNEWKKISSMMVGRSPRQCRERYKNFLHPSLENGPWTQEEDHLLISLVMKIGSKWAYIRHFFPKRSSNNIKNHWTVLFHEFNKTQNSILAMISYLNSHNMLLQFDATESTNFIIPEETQNPTIVETNEENDLIKKNIFPLPLVCKTTKRPMHEKLNPYSIQGIIHA